MATRRGARPPPCLLLLREIAACDDRPFAELARRLGETNARESRLPRVEFVPDVWVLPVKTRTVPPATHTNVWMPGVGRFAIVDPGSGDPGEIERVLAMAERRIALGATPDSVVLTHGHPDHTPGALPLAETLGVPLRAHPNVLQRVLDGTAQATRSPETRALNEGDTVDLDGMTLRALHTPGHDPGHLVFALPERDALIAGDLVSGLSTILVLPPEGDMEAFLASLRRVESVAPRMLLPAHGPPLPGKAISRVIRHREEREARVRAALGPDARDVADIARDAYTDTPGAPRVLAEGQTLAHLLHLERRGLASRSRGTPGPWRGSTG